jgi:hypothetical protein
MFTTREAEREIVRSLASKLRQKAWRMFFPLSGLVNNCPLFLYTAFNSVRIQIHERTTLLRFLGIILRVLILAVSVYNVYITNQFQTAFIQGGGGWVKSVSKGDCELQKWKISRLLSQLRPRIRPQGAWPASRVCSVVMVFSDKLAVVVGCRPTPFHSIHLLHLRYVAPR